MLGFWYRSGKGHPVRIVSIRKFYIVFGQVWSFHRMPNAAKTVESDWYPKVANWLESNYSCFRTSINVGLKHSRVDVLGVRDIGGDLSGEVETIAVEVKNSIAGFATASGQALGYKVYANRVYLAVHRTGDFERTELDIASHLGIGLIQLKAGRCKEVLSSPFHSPIKGMSLQVMEKLALCLCQFCGTLFDSGQIGKSFRIRTSNLSRANFKKALDNEKGMIFWRDELGLRKRRHGVRKSASGAVYDRRYLCPECVELFGEMS